VSEIFAAGLGAGTGLGLIFAKYGRVIIAGMFLSIVITLDSILDVKLD
jgi:hypothetical protein